MAYTIFINNKKLSSSTKKAVDEYVKRLSAFCKITVKTNTSKPDLSSNKEYHICITSDQHKIFSTLTSEDFAKKINRLAVDGLSKIYMYVGYDEYDIKWDETICISHIELDIEILLIALTEQLYRGYTINNNITYHK